MKTVSIHDAKTNLSKYIAAAKKGEKIYIGGFGKAEVLLVAMDEHNTNMEKRSFDIASGKIKATPDAFSTETNKSVAELMLNNK
jgi:antitoxin (DNA-binding transcriptional repressor) of toxin-antitoxin stability system